MASHCLHVGLVWSSVCTDLHPLPQEGSLVRWRDRLTSRLVQALLKERRRNFREVFEGILTGECALISTGQFALHQRLSFLTKPKVSKRGSCVPSGYPEPVEGAVVRGNTERTLVLICRVY